jgi:hypothetical protein
MNPQKSEIHDTTDDAATSPASQFERGAADKDIKIGREVERENDTSAASKTNPDELYPEGVKVKRDESDLGGPIDIEVDTKE